MSLRSVYISPPLVVPALWGLSTGVLVFNLSASPMAMRRSTKTSGPEKALSKRNVLFQIVSGLSSLVPHLVVAYSIPRGGWRFPSWMNRFTFPGPPRYGQLADWRNAGFAIATAGAALYAWSLITLSRAGSFGAFETRERHRLVETGPYNVVRHPIYTSFLLMPIGYSLAMWSSLPLIPGVVTWVTLLLKVPREEAFLETSDAEVGEAYWLYRARVPYALFPGIY